MPIIYNPKIKGPGAITWAISFLKTLRQIYKDNAMPSMIDDSDPDDTITMITKIIKELKKLI